MDWPARTCPAASPATPSVRCRRPRPRERAAWASMHSRCGSLGIGGEAHPHLARADARQARRNRRLGPSTTERDAALDRRQIRPAIEAEVGRSSASRCGDVGGGRVGLGVGDGEGVGLMVGSTVGVSVGAVVGSSVGVGGRLAGAVGVGVASVELGPEVGSSVSVGVGKSTVGDAVGPGAGGRLSKMKIVAPTSTISRNASVAARTCAEREFIGGAAPGGRGRCGRASYPVRARRPGAGGCAPHRAGRAA